MSTSTLAGLVMLLPIVWAVGCGKDRPADESGSSETAESSDSGSSAEGMEAGACSDHVECGFGEVCENGECVPNASGGPCDTDSNCIEGEICEAGGCVPEGGGTEEMGCGGEVYDAMAIPPNVLIVLDRSGSMNESLGDEGTKWEVALAAIGQVVTDFEDQVLFGLSLYPGIDQQCEDGMDCGPGAVFVDVGPDTSMQIIDFLADANTCSFGTPTAEALEPMQDYAGLEDLERPNYILLITDGQSTCEDPVPVVAALRDEMPEIKTFVVGFGDGVDPTELDGMAQAGGTALPGDPTYYQADDAQSLVDAFADIAGSVLSCSYVLDMVPPDPAELYVYINGMAIPRDVTHTDGWDYDPMTNQITFYGPACDLLQSGQVMDLEIIFGCPDAA
jgi:hypothetical protein